MENDHEEQPDPKPEDAGGIGGNLFVKPENQRSDTKMIERAIRNDWPIPASTRLLIANRMSDIVGTSPEERNQIAAARVLIAADGVNVRREALDLKETQGPGGGVNVNVGVQVNTNELRSELLSNEGYLDYCRSCAIDTDAGPLRAERISDAPQAVGNGETLGADRPSGNGHDHGQNGKHLGH